MSLFKVFLLLLILILCLVIFRKLYLLGIALPLFKGGDELITHETGIGKTILLIPGLGNGKESYNWNMSSEDQRNKTGIKDNSVSLQDEISKLGYKVISFDPPGVGDNMNYPIPKNVEDYIKLLHSIAPDAVLVVGHSIGARVAQLYGNTYGCKYIMLDHTPDYKLPITYNKYKENPNNKQYQRTHEFVEMINASVDAIKQAELKPEYIIYSVDDEDPGKADKENYFNSIENNEKIKLINATHWVHITNYNILLDKIKLMIL